MGYSAADTAAKHEQILEQASRLFRERGFSGVSVSEIMKAAGLTHGPFYNHFSSKEELMSEALAYGIGQSLEDLDRLHGDPKAKARYAKNYLSAFHRDHPGKGCSVAALSAEVSQGTEIRSPFTKHLKSLVQKLTDTLTWSSKRTARSEAIQMMAAMAGAIILARAVDDEDFSNEILREVQKSLL